MAGMTKEQMKTNVKEAYAARTGKTMSDGDFNVLIDICQGIIKTMLDDAVIEVDVVGGSSAGKHQGVIKE